MSACSLPLLLLLVTLQGIAVKAEWRVLVELVNYTAPAFGYSGHNCDVSHHQHTAHSECDPIFHLCQGYARNFTCANSLTYNDTNLVIFGQEGAALFPPHIFSSMPANYTLDMKVMDADNNRTQNTIHFHRVMFPNDTMLPGTVHQVHMHQGNYSLYLKLWVECHQPYSGPRCSCKPRGHQLCNATTGLTYCAPGYGGLGCTTVSTHCRLTTCQNGGTCTETTQGFKCHCRTGFVGSHCQTNVNECAHNPCQNGGTCVDDVNAYTCMCAPGFMGARCEDAFNTTAGVPCENGGTSVAGTNTCDCPLGFFGDRCELLVNGCLVEECQNGGRCLAMGDGTFSCECHAGFGGPLCEEDLTDPCSSTAYKHYCRHGGVCHAPLGTPYCICPSGFKGERCELGGSTCSSSPCQNGGTCHEGVSFFSCTCPPGFIGDLCQTDTSRDPLVG